MVDLLLSSAKIIFLDIVECPSSDKQVKKWIVFSKIKLRGMCMKIPELKAALFKAVNLSSLESDASNAFLLIQNYFELHQILKRLQVL